MWERQVLFHWRWRQQYMTIMCHNILVPQWTGAIMFSSNQRHLNSATISMYSTTIHSITHYKILNLSTCLTLKIVQSLTEQWAAATVNCYCLHLAPAHSSCLYVFTKCCPPGLLWGTSCSTSSWVSNPLHSELVILVSSEGRVLHTGTTSCSRYCPVHFSSSALVTFSFHVTQINLPFVNSCGKNTSSFFCISLVLFEVSVTCMMYGCRHHHTCEYNCSPTIHCWVF